MIIAPVLIPTLNRFDHFRRCVESLSKCTHAKDTTLYVALDYPLKDSHWDGYNKTSDFLEKLEGFAEVIVIRREKNFGALRNNDEAQDQIYAVSDRIICIDDDNELAPNFLDYINKGLELFKDDPRVTAICGFPRMVSIPSDFKDNYFCDYSFSAWGFGTWKRVWNAQHWDIEQLVQTLLNPINVYKLHQVFNTIPGFLVRMLNKGRIYGDAIWVCNNIMNESFSIFPVTGKVRNWGHDGTGVHCPTLADSPYHTVEIDKDLQFDFSDNRVVIDDQIHALIASKAKLGCKAHLRFLYDYGKFIRKQLWEHKKLMRET